MKKQLYIVIVIFFLTNCYVSKEHRHWDKRGVKNYPDNHFYQVLKENCDFDSTRIKFNYPYIRLRPDGYFYAYTFDKQRIVYSLNTWELDIKPELDEIKKKQYAIGYYKICGDTLTIEEIGSWKLFNMPWKYVHIKTLGIITNDTIKISNISLYMKEKDKISTDTDIYIPYIIKSNK